MAVPSQGGQSRSSWAGPIGLARTVIKYWALAGGVILVALVIMTAASATMNVLFNRPFVGDYEVVKHGVAIAAFAFLPYCQLTYSNVTVDIFTERAGDRMKAAMVVLSSLVAAGFSLLLLRQMWFGMQDYITYPQAMVSLPVPLWTAFPPALVSLVLLFIASLITIWEGVRGMRGGPAPGQPALLAD
jgi:TRAP-type C4-dicarboxylate transport system permease small subunit